MGYLNRLKNLYILSQVMIMISIGLLIISLIVGFSINLSLFLFLIIGIQFCFYEIIAVKLNLIELRKYISKKL